MTTQRLVTWTAVALALVAGAPGLAHAQTVRNPTVVEFTVSVDHATVTRYEFGFFLGGAEPVQTADLGKCTPNASQICTQSIPSYPIGATYTAKLRAYVDATSGDWSDASNPFFRTPAPPPAAPVIR
jgi:hypothetical protein